MSGIFDEGSAQQPPVAPPRRTPSRRPRALIPTLAVVVLLVVLFSVFVEVWTGRMWFNALGFGDVFTTVLWTRIGLFVVFGLALAAVTVANIMLAFRMRPILIGDGYRNPTVERYQDTIDPIRNWIVGGVGVLMFLFGVRARLAIGRPTCFGATAMPSARRMSTSARTSDSSSSVTPGTAS